jgi:hypothetical protein
MIHLKYEQSKFSYNSVQLRRTALRIEPQNAGSLSKGRRGRRSCRKRQHFPPNWTTLFRKLAGQINQIPDAELAILNSAARRHTGRSVLGRGQNCLEIRVFAYIELQRPAVKNPKSTDFKSIGASGRKERQAIQQPHAGGGYSDHDKPAVVDFAAYLPSGLR